MQSQTNQNSNNKSDSCPRTRLRFSPVTRLQSHKDPVGSGRRSYRQFWATPLVQWQNIRDQCRVLYPDIRTLMSWSRWATNSSTERLLRDSTETKSCSQPRSHARLVGYRWCMTKSPSERIGSGSDPGMYCIRRELRLSDMTIQDRWCECLTLSIATAIGAKRRSVQRTQTNRVQQNESPSLPGKALEMSQMYLR